MCIVKKLGLWAWKPGVIIALVVVNIKTKLETLGQPAYVRILGWKRRRKIENEKKREVERIWAEENEDDEFVG